jgi:two-component system nitrogen regulation sensor histidine kinase GlnL
MTETASLAADGTGRRDRLEAIVNALPTPVILVDGANRIRFVNGAAETFFQAGSTVLCKGTLDHFIPFASPLLALVDQVREQGSSVNEYSLDIGTPRTGGQRQMDVQVTSLPELPGNVLVTLQPRAMAQQIDRQLNHRGAARSVSGMATMLAHEIKNPLSGIRGAAQLLESSLNDDDRALTRLICDESDRICGLVDQFEVFTDERPLGGDPVNIHAVLDHVKSIAINGFAKNIKFVEEYDPSLPPVPGNRDLLVQVFLNLIKNAAEAVNAQDGEGEIGLTTAFRPGIKLAVPGVLERVALPLECCVRDTGGGVPDELLPHLFDPFVTTKAAGKGLGLALVAKVVRDHGGIVECDSSNRRTTFRILLPMYREASQWAPGAANGLRTGE